MTVGGYVFCVCVCGGGVVVVVVELRSLPPSSWEERGPSELFVSSAVVCGILVSPVAGCLLDRAGPPLINQ